MDDRLILIAVLAALIVLMSMWQLLGVRVQKLCNQNERLIEQVGGQYFTDISCPRIERRDRP